MTIRDMVLGVCGIAALVMTVVQIAPIKIDPWTKIARAIGRAINSELLQKQEDTRRVLDKHIADDDERNADTHRARILRFNLELIRNLPHTREDYIEVLSEIDKYEAYCSTHPNYKNNRAVCAIENIKRTYAQRMQKHDFVQC